MTIGQEILLFVTWAVVLAVAGLCAFLKFKVDDLEREIKKKITQRSIDLNLYSYEIHRNRKDIKGLGLAMHDVKKDIAALKSGKEMTEEGGNNGN